ncbi:DUF350 domain-containing protein [Crenobacter cavernae]|uniref:DUF350 domain-containing protein n=1 Tax=Crenobacter cavernae TaxID=2290923 RepID=A0A345Y944_9NEIS|nr:DUF350 domain-containing protein [Crenobacter cavernae]AXK40446.1 DUF350 domain-containing protein [Crenobacter cavernae]
MLAAFYNYLIYLLSASALLMVFITVYTRVTPMRELPLIREGCTAAALSLGGAVIGFSLTLAASILFHSTLTMVLAWAGSAMLVQLVAYVLLERFIPGLPRQIEENNVAVGALVGAVALAAGVINAACLS